MGRRKVKPGRAAHFALRRPEATPVARVRAHERLANQRSARDRELYSGHRERVTSLLLERGGPGKRLCLLGAGNCNDVNLERLAGAYEEIHLVDIDDEALAAASTREREAVARKLILHGAVDLSGIFESLPAFHALDRPGIAEPAVFAQAVLETVGRESAKVVRRLPGPFDAVASLCVSTQMSWALSDILNPSHPRLETLRVGMMMAHWRTLSALAASPESDCYVFWFTDTVSSDRVPLEEAIIAEGPRGLLARVIEEGMVYPGGNPQLIERTRQSDPVGAHLQVVKEPEPWLWRTPLRSYLVWAGCWKSAASNIRSRR